MESSTLPSEVKAELESARAAVEIERARAEAAYLQMVSASDRMHANVVRESVDYYGRSNDYVDRRTPYIDAGYGMVGDMELPALPEDTRDGRFHPFWDTMEELRIIQGTSRYLATYNEMGVSLLEGLTDHAVHTGFSHTIEPLPHVNDASEILIRACQSILDEFHRRTNWICVLEGEYFSESVAWGEQFAYVRDIGGGLADVEIIPVPQICEPRLESRTLISQYEGLPDLNWSFGIGTRYDSPSRPEAYFQNIDNTNRNWRILSASDVVHVKRNVPAQSVKRGLSDFFPLARVLKKCSPLLYNMVVGGAMRASIGYITKSAAGGGMLTPLGNTATVRPSPTGGMDRIDIHRPGQVKHLSGGLEIASGPMGDANEAGLVSILQAGYRIIGLRWRMPEYMSTADASSINRATSDAAESPFVRSMERRQKPYAIAFTEIDWKVLDIAARHGRLREFGIVSRNDLEQRILIKVQPPDVEKHDKLEDGQHNQSLVANKVMSRRTWAEKLGLKFDEEKKRIQEEESELGPVGQADEFTGRDPENGAALFRPAMQLPPTMQPVQQQQQPGSDVDLRFNGAQITAAIDVLKSVSSGELPNVAAIELLKGIGIDPSRAASMVAAAAAIEPLPEPIAPPKLTPLPANATQEQRIEFSRQLAHDLLFHDYP